MKIDYVTEIYGTKFAMQQALVKKLESIRKKERMSRVKFDDCVKQLLHEDGKEGVPYKTFAKDPSKLDRDTLMTGNLVLGVSIDDLFRKVPAYLKKPGVLKKVRLNMGLKREPAGPLELESAKVYLCLSLAERLG